MLQKRARKAYRLFLYPCVLLALMEFVSTLAQAPALEMSKSKFYDPFGDETTLIYHGGYVMVSCAPAVGDPCDAEFELIGPQNQSVNKKSCSVQEGGATIRFDINDATPLGEFRCRYKNQVSSDSMEIHYYLCSVSDPSFPKKPCPTDEAFCVVTGQDKKTTTPCAAIKQNWCTYPAITFRLCPGDHVSSCVAASKNAKAYAKMNLAVCPAADAEVPQLTYQTSEARRYNEPIQMDPTAKDPTRIALMLVPNAPLDGSNVTYIIKFRNGTVLETKSAISGFGGVQLDVTQDIFKQGPQVFKFIATYFQDGAEKASLSNYLVVLVGNVGIKAKDAEGHTEKLYILKPADGIATASKSAHIPSWVWIVFSIVCAVGVIASFGTFLYAQFQNSSDPNCNGHEMKCCFCAHGSGTKCVCKEMKEACENQETLEEVFRRAKKAGTAAPSMPPRDNDNDDM